MAAAEHAADGAFPEAHGHSGGHCGEPTSNMQSSRGYRLAVLKTFTAEDGSALCGTERNGGLLAALRTDGPGLYFCVMVVLRRGARVAKHGDALGLAGLAPFGFVLELLIVKKELFSGREDKLRTAIDAL